jgi:hypothetical protein
VARRHDIRVTFADRRERQAKFAGADAKTDLAVLKLSHRLIKGGNPSEEEARTFHRYDAKLAAMAKREGSFTQSDPIEEAVRRDNAYEV